MTTSQPQSSHVRSPREGLPDVVAMACAALLAGVLLYVLFHGKLTRFDEIGLGLETNSVFAEVDGDRIHCMDFPDIEQCLAGAARRGALPTVVWLGNSQLHGVNQYEPGQQTAAARLAERLRARGLDVLAFSQPNANLQEHLVLYNYLVDRLPIRWLVLPLVFDDAREAGVRTMLAQALEPSAARARLGATAIGRSILASTASSSDPDLAALDETVQERSERALDAWLESHVELWELRPEARGRIFQWLNGLRNFVFRVDAASKRRMIEGRYLQNLAAAEEILADAQRRQIRVVLYIAPIRGEIELPYFADEYARFQRDTKQLAMRYGASFENLESIVPAASFGFMASDSIGVEREPDFMHFQASGHALLADRVAAAIERGSEPRTP